MLSTTAKLTPVALDALNYISKTTNKPANGNHEEQGQAGSFFRHADGLMCVHTSCLTTGVFLNVCLCMCACFLSETCLRVCLAWLPFTL